MPFPFTCPHCHAKTWVDDRYAGKSGPCAQCGQLVVIPLRGRADSGGEPSPALSVAMERRQKWVRLGMFALSGIVLGGLLLTAVVLVATPAVMQANALRKRSLSLTNLRQIAAALNSYAALHGTYPPPVVVDGAGLPLYSWRVLILPQLGHQELYEQFNKEEAWNGPTNILLQSRMPEEYASPGSPDAGGLFQSNYVLLVGNGTLFPSSGPLSPTMVRDSLDETILVTETGNAGKIWSQPYDIDVSRRAKLGTTPYVEIGGNHDGYAVAVTVSQQPLILSESTSPIVLDALITPNGGELIDIAPFREQ